MANMIRACVDEALPKVGRRDPAERKQRALAAIGRLGKGPADRSRLMLLMIRPARPTLAEVPLADPILTKASAA
jgi:hypothetical protein